LHVEGPEKARKKLTKKGYRCRSPVPICPLGMEMNGDAPGARDKQTVVLVEDDIEVRDLIAILFEMDGRFEVVAEAGDGASGLEAVQLHRPTAVVLDLQLPVLPGTAAIAAMRMASPHTRIVVFSAFPDPFTLLDVLQHGADSYLDKATAWEELVPVVAHLCELSEQLGA
jgi:DNA-binding NarL/FixJ family response regulator